MYLLIKVHDVIPKLIGNLNRAVEFTVTQTVYLHEAPSSQ